MWGSGRKLGVLAQRLLITPTRRVRQRLTTTLGVMEYLTIHKLIMLQPEHHQNLEKCAFKASPISSCA